MCHISELEEGRVENVTDVCNEGDTLDVIVLNVDERSGKVRLSRRVAMMESEEDVAEAIAEASKPRPRGPRREGRGGGRRPRRD